MRGEERQQRSMLMVLNLAQRVPREHPLRRIKQLAETVLQGLSASFDRMYSATGRPSIPPERLLKASLLMALYTVRSERLLCEQLDYNLLFRWFLGDGVGRGELRPFQLQRQSQAAVGTRGGGRVLPGSGGAGARAQAALRRALHGGRHPDRGLGLA